MLGNALALAVLHAILALSTSPVPDPVDENSLRAARLVGEFLEPLAERRPDAVLGGRLPGLISRLGSAEWSVREAASRELVRYGMPAAGALREAVRSRDPEVAFRAREALADIPTVELERILDGLETYLGDSVCSPQRRIVAELALIPAAAEATLVRLQEAERAADTASERCAQETEEAGDRAGSELHRFSGRLAKSRLDALTALAEYVNREVADLRAAEEIARETAREKAKEAAKNASQPDPQPEAAAAATVAVAAPAPGK